MDELNGTLKGEVNQHLEYLLKKIGNNRQQLTAKVMGFYRDINKELNKEKVEAVRKEEILRELASLEKMAAKQLPYFEPFVLKPIPPAPAKSIVQVPAKVAETAPKKPPVKPEPAKPKAVAKPKAKTPAKPGKAAAKKKKK